MSVLEAVGEARSPLACRMDASEHDRLEAELLEASIHLLGFVEATMREGADRRSRCDTLEAQRLVARTLRFWNVLHAHRSAVS